MSRLDAATLAALKEYAKDIQSLPNESAKTHRFVALVERLFPGSGATTELTAGVEKLVRVDIGGRTKRGHIDAYHGNAIIEFENSLRSKEAEACRQLREYCAGLWKDEKQRRRPLVCIASDGLVWKVSIPASLMAAGPLRPPTSSWASRCAPWKSGNRHSRTSGFGSPACFSGWAASNTARVSSVWISGP